MNFTEQELEKTLLNFQETVSNLSDTEDHEGTRKIFRVLTKNWKEFGINTLASDILKAHAPTTSDHLSYLIIAGLQYVSDFSFTESTSMEEGAIQDLIGKMVKNKYEDIVEVCARNNVSTNIPNRYAPLSALISVHQGNPKVIELGSSFGLGAWSTRLPDIAYENVVFDNPEFEKLAKGVPKNIKYTGVDLVNQLNYDPKWLQACLVFGYTSLMPKIDKLLSQIQKESPSSNGLKFIQKDIFDATSIASVTSQADILWSSSTMYIFGDNPTTARNRIFPVVNKILKPSGLFVAADYIDWKNYSDKDNVYRVTCARPSDWSRELILCESRITKEGEPKDMCQSWEKGKDWDEIISIIKK